MKLKKYSKEELQDLFPGNWVFGIYEFSYRSGTGYGMYYYPDGRYFKLFSPGVGWTGTGHIDHVKLFYKKHFKFANFM